MNIQLTEYWQQTARDLINTRTRTDGDMAACARWIGQASAVLGEALRLCGEDYAQLMGAAYPALDPDPLDQLLAARADA